MNLEAPSFWRPSTWPLQSRIGVALSGVSALLIALVVAAAALQVQVREAQHLVVVDYYNALRASQNYFVAMVDSETAVRGYALSGEEATLVPMRNAGQPWQKSLEPVVEANLDREDVPVAQVRRLEAASQAWYRQWAEPTIRRTAAGSAPSAAEIDAGRQLFDDVRASYTEYITALRQDREDAAERLTLLTNLLFQAVVADALIAVGGGVALWYLLRRWVSKPVAHLGREVQQVRDSHLEHEVSAFGPPEFVRLGGDVEAMRQRLVAQIAAVASAGEQIAAARTALEHQASELQRSNRELEQFAYVASHDLQEPLRKVASFCQMLQRRYSGQLDERADQYIFFAVDGAKRMQQLINDLLEYSRVGRLTTPRTEVDLGECLRGALFNLQSAREEAGAQVTADELPRVLGEAPLLTQLLQNLIGNAIKFRSEAPPRIHLGVRRVGDDWEYWCSDNGIGIEAEYAERVFLIFQRLHAKEVYGGTGIGLAMCKKIVEHHGGRIWVDETGRDAVEPGRGTTLRFTLPVIRPLVADPAGVDVPVGASGA